MKKFITTLAMFALVLVCGISFAACGGNSKPLTLADFLAKITDYQGNYSVKGTVSYNDGNAHLDQVDFEVDGVHSYCFVTCDYLTEDAYTYEAYTNIRDGGIDQWVWNTGTEAFDYLRYPNETDNNRMYDVYNGYMLFLLDLNESMFTGSGTYTYVSGIDALASCTIKTTSGGATVSAVYAANTYGAADITCTLSLTVTFGNASIPGADLVISGPI